MLPHSKHGSLFVLFVLFLYGCSAVPDMVTRPPMNLVVSPTNTPGQVLIEWDSPYRDSYGGNPRAYWGVYVQGLGHPQFDRVKTIANDSTLIHWSTMIQGLVSQKPYLIRVALSEDAFWTYKNTGFSEILLVTPQ